MKTTRRPMPPRLISDPISNTDNKQASTFALKTEEIEKSLKDDNSVHYRLLAVLGLGVILSIGLYFLMTPLLWQTIITALILITLMSISAGTAIFSINYNKKILKNLQEEPFLTVQNNSIKIADIEIFSENIHSIIHAKIKDTGALSATEMILNGEHLYLFAESDEKKQTPSVIKKYKTLHTSIYHIPLNLLQDSEKFLKEVQKFSNFSNIAYKESNTSSYVANEAIRIHKKIAENEARQKKDLAKTEITHSTEQFVFSE